jgi:ferredoxin
VGSRICTAVAPNVFTLNEDSQAAVVNAEGDTLETIKMAAEACPVSAITVEETTE